MLSKKSCEGVQLIVKLPAISLKPCKFTKNELLHTYFSRTLTIFSVIFYFPEGSFMFQWGEGVVCFR